MLPAVFCVRGRARRTSGQRDEARQIVAKVAGAIAESLKQKGRPNSPPSLSRHTSLVPPAYLPGTLALKLF